MQARLWVVCLISFLALAGSANAQVVEEPGLCTFDGKETCVGDCNDDRKVAINELILGVNISLGTKPIKSCKVLDTNSDNKVAINELIKGVNASVVGCDASALTLCSVLFSGCAQPFGTKGAMQINCTEGDGGAKNCSCELRSFDPVNIPGIGVACVRSTDAAGNPIECPARPYECNGGAPLNIDLTTSATIGTCTGNEDCKAKCETHCAGLTPSKVWFNSGCDLFCQGGTRENQPCQCDTAGTSTCPDTRKCKVGTCSVTSTQTCQKDSDCGRCSISATSCTKSADCPTGETCEFDEECERGDCSVDTDCLEGGTCEGAGQCSATTKGCTSNADCPTGEVCQSPPLDCPGGQCVGKDLEPESDCQCQCIDEADGDPAPAGAFQCRLGVRIVVEATSSPLGYCDGKGELVRLPPLCAAFTSETAAAVIQNANEKPGVEIGPVSLTGNGLACSTFDTGATKGLNPVANLTFFDSTIGDLVAQLNIYCR